MELLINKVNIFDSLEELRTYISELLSTIGSHKDYITMLDIRPAAKEVVVSIYKRDNLMFNGLFSLN